MIELISESRCTKCNICVRVCPTNVFDIVPGGVPVIARQDSCQTCFMCELNCPADAMFVAPTVTPAPEDSPWRDEAHLAETGALGRRRELEGWGRGRTPMASTLTGMGRTYILSPDTASASRS